MFTYLEREHLSSFTSPTFSPRTIWVPKLPSIHRDPRRSRFSQPPLPLHVAPWRPRAHYPVHPAVIQDAPLHEATPFGIGVESGSYFSRISSTAQGSPLPNACKRISLASAFRSSSSSARSFFLEPPGGLPRGFPLSPFLQWERRFF